MPTPQPKPEDEKKPKPKPTKPKDDFGLDDMFSGFDAFQQPEFHAPIPIPDEPKAKPVNRIRKASKSDTKNATKGIDIGDQGMNHLNNLMNNMDDFGFADPEPEDPPTTDLSTQVNTPNVPKVGGNDLIASGMLNPAFHQVSSLPGNMMRAINILGKQLFGSFTRTPTKDIYMVGDLGGQGPNDKREVNAVASTVVNKGQEVSAEGDVNFDPVMPGYKADIKEYSLDGVRYLIVKDFAGNYVYAWPEQDSIKKSGQAALGKPDMYALESFLMESKLLKEEDDLINIDDSGFVESYFDAWDEDEIQKYDSFKAANASNIDRTLAEMNGSKILTFYHYGNIELKQMGKDLKILMDKFDIDSTVYPGKEREAVAFWLYMESN